MDVPVTPEMIASTKNAERSLALETVFKDIAPLLLLSPPRSNSSVFATALRHNSRVRRYVHEPCGRHFHEGLPTETIVEDLGQLEAGLLIKEMSFQMRDPEVARALLMGCKSPIVCLVRAPVLTIESRVRLTLINLLKDRPEMPTALREEISEAIKARDFSGLDSVLTEETFPLIRTGWADLGAQIAFCRQAGVDHVVVETSDFRATPEALLAALCPRIGLELEMGMLSWEPSPNLLPGALQEQAVWYERITSSRQVQPPDAHQPSPDELPPRIRAHLPEAIDVYEAALSEPAHVVRAATGD